MSKTSIDLKPELSPLIAVASTPKELHVAMVENIPAVAILVSGNSNEPFCTIPLNPVQARQLAAELESKADELEAEAVSARIQRNIE